MGKRIFLIDGHSLLHRAFHGVPSLTTREGVHTNGVYGFALMLFRLLDDYEPDAIFVAFDTSEPTFRHEKFADYKATRKKMPDELRPQVGLIKEVLDAWGIPRLELAGYEADDIIGTAAKLGEKEGHSVFIVTGDRDALQLVSDDVQVLFTKKGTQDLDAMDPQALKEAYELKPGQIPDLKGLMGDSSDNIPGVPGVGEKTALKLLKRHESVDRLYEELEQEKGKLKERLAENKDQAFLSRDLARIDCRVPIDINFGQEVRPQWDQLRQIFARLEFRSLLDQTQSDETDSGEADLSVDEINELEAIRDWLTAVEPGSQVAVDILDGSICLFVGSSALHIPSASVTSEVGAALLQTLQDAQIHCFDSKALYHALQVYGELPIMLDLALAGYVLDPGGPTDLDMLAQRYAGLSPINVSSQTADREAQVAARRCRRLLELAPVLMAKLEDDELWKLYNELELPLARVLARMEARGILVDPDKLEEMSEDLRASLDQLTQEIHDMAGESFNINSPKQLGHILFEVMGLPVVKRTKTGPSTDAEVLEQLSDQPIVGKILEYRQVKKLKSTYTDALRDLISPSTKRIHTTFNQMVTATGRLSSTNPNLQNIPIRRPEGKKIREAFVSADEWLLLAADYSQIELRILAHISEDESFISAFNSGRDIHTQTASEVFGLPMESVTSEQRSAAKAINFGIVYGISSYGLARGTNLSREKAQEYIDGYFARYPKVKGYLDEAVKQAREKGYVTTLLGRRRYLTDIKNSDFTKRSFAERMAMNTPIQGSAADVIKLAMLAVEERLEAENMRGRLLLQVHDELVLEVPKDELKAAAVLVQNAMESVMKLRVQLAVDVSAGTNWRDVQPLSDADLSGVDS